MKITLTDAGILELYSLWSEENYSAGFIGASPQMVRDFRTWLHGLSRPSNPGSHYDYEGEMLMEFFNQQMEEAPLDHDQS